MNRYLISAYPFGLFGGVLALVGFWVFYLVDLDPITMSIVFNFVNLSLFIGISIYYFKKYRNNEYLSFAHGMSVGFFTYVIIATISFLGIYASLSVFPEVFGELKAERVQMLETEGVGLREQVGENAYLKTLEEVKDMRVYHFPLNDFIWKILFGLFLSIIISIILRRNKL
ncbi:DUF4199 domain-containing protein [Pleomorphovibrio marinus]|uniref:DUF4199 domain-containing protein n=1 Tax=Pleomorphovibrio marinus TaxID=2164132 RepID=UPI000E0CACF5|nr:DUF4199 domain-containing protein [Pleomorphovibrio marinus]